MWGLPHHQQHVRPVVAFMFLVFVVTFLLTGDLGNDVVREQVHIHAHKNAAGEEETDPFQVAILEEVEATARHVARQSMKDSSAKLEADTARVEKHAHEVMAKKHRYELHREWQLKLEEHKHTMTKSKHDVVHTTRKAVQSLVQVEDPVLRLHLLQAADDMKTQLKSMQQRVVNQAAKASTITVREIANRATRMSNKAMSAASNAHRAQHQAAQAAAELLHRIEAAQVSARVAGHVARKRMWKAFKAERDAVHLMERQALVQRNNDLKVALARAQVFRRHAEMTHIRHMQHEHARMVALKQLLHHAQSGAAAARIKEVKMKRASKHAIQQARAHQAAAVQEKLASERLNTNKKLVAQKKAQQAARRAKAAFKRAKAEHAAASKAKAEIRAAKKGAAAARKQLLALKHKIAEVQAHFKVRLHTEHLATKKAIQHEQKRTQEAKRKAANAIAAAKDRINAEHLKWKNVVQQQRKRSSQLLATFKNARAGSKKMAQIMEKRAQALATSVTKEQLKMKKAVQRAQKRTEAVKHDSAQAIAAANARVKTERQKWKKTVKQQKMRSQKLLATFKRARAASTHVAQAMVRKAKKIASAANTMKMKLSQIKKRARQEIKRQVKKAKRQELMKMVAAQTRTAEAAAEAVIHAKRQAEIARAKLIVKYTGTVPKNLGRAATHAAKRERNKQLAVMKASSNKNAAQGLQLVYEGCFSDRVADRDLPHHVPVPAADPAKCAAMCQAMNTRFEYAALQHGDQCFCGASYGRHGREPPATCFMRCKDSPSKLCGGVSRNSVYHVKKH